MAGCVRGYHETWDKENGDNVGLAHLEAILAASQNVKKAEKNWGVHRNWGIG